MSAPNTSRSHPTFFILVGIPGMEKSHTWISIPVCMMYCAALLGNLVLLVTVAKERSLQEPMYIFLCLLAVCDLLLSTATVPKILGVLQSLSTQISFSGCLAQMFSIYFIFVVESAILLAMAFDWHIAICKPLQYTAVLTHSVMGKVVMAALIRSFCIMLPAIFLLKRLPYCGHNVMPHTYCEHIGVGRLACTDISINIWYGVAAGFLSAGLDVISIAVSCVLILRCLWGLPSPRTSPRALHTCGSHLCVITMFYTPAFFSFLAHRFSQHVPQHILISFANLYIVVLPMLNPIVYGVRTKQIREHVAHLLRLRGLSGRT
ncbi:LOW QUALITY PROTEIN: olfactory receptor 52B2-like [Falco peregrinus]|uniref:LOW QUALITY PROTEIN: olfactory receptor 52B2-like n=1 Tax=Falco peregrinus TaxID=8954 RepID=UPI0024790865|nr:LOW QUALITY PROTEIN: olfactory receptor 52B2-like [Falco peregrinus]